MATTQPDGTTATYDPETDELVVNTPTEAIQTCRECCGGPAT